MKTAALFLGGSYPSSKEFYNGRLSKADLVVAVDSGAEMLRCLGVYPHLLVGDMDSLSRSSYEWCVEHGSETLLLSVEKDDTDTEIAIRELERRGVSEVEVFGATGKRPDHFIATIFSIYNACNRLKILISEENLQIGIIRGFSVFKVQIGETWSFFPFGENIPSVTLYGFKYPLLDHMLDYSKPLGVSNVTVEKEITVFCKGGTLLYFRWLKEFW